MNAYEKYNFAVCYKINQLSAHPHFEKFKEYQECALRQRTGFGLDAIRADVFIDLIILRSFEEIVDQINGKHKLQYTNEEKQNTDKHVIEACEKNLFRAM